MPGPVVSVQLGVCEVEVGIVAGVSDHFYVWSNRMWVNGHIDALMLQSRLWRSLCDEGHLNG